MYSNTLYINATRPKSNPVWLYLDAPPTGEEAMFPASYPLLYSIPQLHLDVLRQLG